jgi:hypothetical protein
VPVNQLAIDFSAPWRLEIPPRERQRVAEIVLGDLERAGVLGAFVGALRIEWSTRTTSTMGLARYAPSLRYVEVRGDKRWCWRPGAFDRLRRASIAREYDAGPPSIALVTLSVRHWLVASQATRDDTVHHEVAHLVDDHRYGIGVGRRSPEHGASWHRVFEEIAGYRGSRCHNVRLPPDLRSAPERRSA